MHAVAFCVPACAVDAQRAAAVLDPAAVDLVRRLHVDLMRLGTTGCRTAR